METRIGGHHTQGQTLNLTDSSKTSHEANSRQAVDIAQRTWHVSDDCARPESKSPFIEDEQVKNAIKSARQSELQVHTHVSSSATQPSNNGSVTSRFEASEADVQAWLDEIKTRHGDDGRLVLNEKQYDMAFLVATQVCKDIRARNTNDYTDWCPLRWSMHGCCLAVWSSQGILEGLCCQASCMRVIFDVSLFLH